MWIPNHAVNIENRRSHSGIIIYVKNASIIWYIKIHNTVEASSFGSDFVSLRIATQSIEALQYKLRCFGAPVEGPEEVFCDKKPIVNNSSIPTPVLNKIHNAKCYHMVREDQDVGVIRVGCITEEFNLAHFFTKTMMPRKTRHNLAESIFSNTSPPIGGIDQAQVNLHMGESKYPPH